MMQRHAYFSLAARFISRYMCSCCYIILNLQRVVAGKELCQGEKSAEGSVNRYAGFCVGSDS